MRGCVPFPRVCLGSSVISESIRSREHALRAKVPCVRDLRPGGAGGAAELLRRERTGANGQAGWCWLLTAAWQMTPRSPDLAGQCTAGLSSAGATGIHRLRPPVASGQRDCRGDRRTAGLYPLNVPGLYRSSGLTPPGSGQLAFTQAATECHIILTLGYRRGALRIVCAIGVR